MSTSTPSVAQIAQRESLAAASLALAELRKPAELALVPALPKKPEGWTKRIVMHLNMGRSGHSGVYEVFYADGNKSPIRYQYHTKDKSLCGFTLEGLEGVMSWARLREVWPAWVESRARETP